LTKKMFLLVLLILFCCNFSYAGKLTSKEAVNYYNEGVKLQKDSNFAAADLNYQKALLLDPNNTNWQKLILNNRGLMFAKIGDLENAEVSFKAALRIDPNYKPAQLNLGLVIERRFSRCEALEYWAKLFNWESSKPKEFIMAEPQK